jgi:hypothetical protein
MNRRYRILPRSGYEGAVRIEGYISIVNYGRPEACKMDRSINLTGRGRSNLLHCMEKGTGEDRTALNNFKLSRKMYVVSNYNALSSGVNNRYVHVFSFVPGGSIIIIFPAA